MSELEKGNGRRRRKRKGEKKKERSIVVVERTTFQSLFQVGSSALFDARRVGQVKSAITTTVVRCRHARSLHLVRGRQVLHQFTQSATLVHHQLLGDLRADDALLVPLRSVRVRVNPYAKKKK